ncbi:MAG: DUF3667 domain-containing protein [Bacteroidales bacterium]|nr:DUF3667 domain-containing protein [Bacteroidales bacterium]
MKKRFKIKEKIHQFKAWRERPREVAPMSQEEHECLNCHDHYTGNYCPRCGQAASTDRFSMKVAAENFAEAYGMGERGMFRTILDLILRPGHLILDYLRGRRASYFAPFKMYFLLAAVSLLVTHGLNITGHALHDDSENTTEEVKREHKSGKTTKTTNDFEENTPTMEQGITIDEDGVQRSFDKDYPKESRIYSIIYSVLDKIERFEEKYPSINILLLLMLISGNLFLFFRHSPNIPDLRYPELFISLVYIANMYTVYSIVFDFFSLTKLASLSIFLTIIPLKQMSGYSWWRTILKTVVAFTIMFVLLIVFIVLAVLGVRLFVEYHG